MQYTAHKSLTAYIREQYAPQLVFPAILLLLAVVVLLNIPHQHRNVQPTNSLAEAVAAYPEHREVTISTGTLYYTGLNYESHGISRIRIYYTLEDDICYYLLLTETSANRNATTLEGGIYTVVLDHNDSIYQAICASMSEALSFSTTNLSAMSCDILFNQYEYTNGFFTFISYAIHILAMLCLCGILYCLIVLIRPEAAICVQRLRRYGKASTLFALAITEFDSATPIGRRNLYVTDNYFIALLPKDIIIQPLDNVVWIYQTHEVKHMHGHVKMIHTLCIVNERKKTYKISNLSEPVIATLINAIASEHSHILVGNAWTK